MKSLAIVYGLVALLIAPIPAHAAEKKAVTGALLVLSGTGLIVGAFDYHTACPPGYSRHTYEGAKTQCVIIYPSGGSDVRGEATTADYRRPVMLKVGVAAASVGTILLLLPKRAAKVAPSISVTPTGWLASKTIGF